MSQKHHIEDDVLDAVREDELASIIAELRERDQVGEVVTSLSSLSGSSRGTVACVASVMTRIPSAC